MSLVDDVRELVSAGSGEYTTGGITYWSDPQLQERLDARRRLTTREPVTYIPEIGAGGTATHKRAKVSANGRFEPGTTGAGGTLVDSLGGTAPTWTIDRHGWIDFAADTGGTAYYLTAWSYDVHAAAADVLDAWRSHLKLGYDFATEDQRFDRSQRLEQLSAQADILRRSQLPGTVRFLTGNG